MKFIRNNGMKRLRTRVLALGIAVPVVASALVVIGAPSAVAHTGEVTPTCGGVSVNLTSFNGQLGPDGQPKNRFVLTFDGQSAEDTRFGESFENAYSVDPNVEHDFVATWTAFDDSRYSGTVTGKTLVCYTDEPIAPKIDRLEANCNNRNITVTPVNQVGVRWNPSGPTVLQPGESVTYKATNITRKKPFPPGTQTSFPFKNDFNAQPCQPVYNPRGSIDVSCTGQVRFVMDNRDSNRGLVFEYQYETGNTIKGRGKYVKPGVRKVVKVRSVNGSVVYLYALDTLLAKKRVPQPCPVRRLSGSLDTSCHQKVQATIDNSRSNRWGHVFFEVVRPNGGGANGIQLSARPGAVRDYYFGGERFPRGTTVTMTNADNGKVLDKVAVPKRCTPHNPPPEPPDGGMRIKAPVSGKAEVLRV